MASIPLADHFALGHSRGGSPFVLTCNYCHSKNYAVSLSRMIDYRTTVEETATMGSKLIRNRISILFYNSGGINDLAVSDQGSLAKIRKIVQYLYLA